MMQADRMELCLKTTLCRFALVPSILDRIRILRVRLSGRFTNDVECDVQAAQRHHAMGVMTSMELVICFVSGMCHKAPDDTLWSLTVSFAGECIVHCMEHPSMDDIIWYTLGTELIAQIRVSFSGLSTHSIPSPVP